MFILGEGFLTRYMISGRFKKQGVKNKNCSPTHLEQDTQCTAFNTAEIYLKDKIDQHNHASHL